MFINKKYEQRQVDEIVGLLKEGHSIVDLAKKFNIPYGTIKSWKNKNRKDGVEFPSVMKKATATKPRIIKKKCGSCVYRAGSSDR